MLKFKIVSTVDAQKSNIFLILEKYIFKIEKYEK